MSTLCFLQVSRRELQQYIYSTPIIFENKRLNVGRAMNSEEVNGATGWNNLFIFIHQRCLSSCIFIASYLNVWIILNGNPTGVGGASDQADIADKYDTFFWQSTLNLK